MSSNNSEEEWDRIPPQRVERLNASCSIQLTAIMAPEGGTRSCLLQGVIYYHIYDRIFFFSLDNIFTQNLQFVLNFVS